MGRNHAVGVSGLKVYSSIGVFEEERLLKNQLMIDVEVETGTAEKYEGLVTIDYSTLVNIIMECAEKQHNLLEELMYDINENILKAHRDIKRIKIKIRKLNPAMGLRMDDVFVKMKWKK